eukprot:gene12378-16605_t
MGSVIMNCRTPNSNLDNETMFDYLELFEKNGKLFVKQKNRHEVEILPSDENLGGDLFESTPWLPPSLAKVEEYKSQVIYRYKSHETRESSTQINDKQKGLLFGGTKSNPLIFTTADDLDISDRLYFIWLKVSFIVLILLLCLSIPTLLFAINGHNISPKNNDILYLYKLSFGNIGLDKSSSTYFYNDHLCDRQKAKSVDSKNDPSSNENAIFVSSYSILVKNLPEDVTEKELIDHFSNLYQLKITDFRKRPAIEGVRPVNSNGYMKPLKRNDEMEYNNFGIESKSSKGYENTHLFHKDSQLINGTWIAECVFHHPISSFIHSIHKKQELFNKLMKCRAYMKMYGDKTCHSDGRNIEKYEFYRTEMLKLVEKIDEINRKNLEDRQNYTLLLEKNDRIFSKWLQSISMNAQNNTHHDFEENSNTNNHRITQHLNLHQNLIKLIGQI